MEAAEAIQRAAERLRDGQEAGEVFEQAGLTESRDRRAAESLAAWLETREQLESGKADTVKLENAVKAYQEQFNRFYDAVNDFLVVHGYEPIGFIKGYVPQDCAMTPSRGHAQLNSARPLDGAVAESNLQPEANQNALGKVLEAMGLGNEVSKLPVSIAGRTRDFKPGKRWNPYFLSRNGGETQYDIAKAYESYVDYMSDVLYHTDDIMRVREAGKYFRRTYAPEDIREGLRWAQDVRSTGSAAEKAEFLREMGISDHTSAMTSNDIDRALENYIEKQYKDLDNTTKFSDFVVYLDDYANNLAAKQVFADRDMERTFGRLSLNIGKKLSNAFARAQVAGNLSSALNQTSQLPLISAELGTRYTARAWKDNWNGQLRRGAWAMESDFLAEKNGVDYITTTPEEMIISGLFKPAEFVDGFLSTLAVRGKYLQEIDAGKSHQEAMRSADRFGRRVMGSRAKGSTPLAFQSRNFFSKALHMFQPLGRLRRP